jgi:hypothetical protein
MFWQFGGNVVGRHLEGTAQNAGRHADIETEMWLDGQAEKYKYRYRYTKWHREANGSRWSVTSQEIKLQTARYRRILCLYLLCFLFRDLYKPEPGNIIFSSFIPPFVKAVLNTGERKFTLKESYFISMSEHMKSRDAKMTIFLAAYTFQTYLSIWRFPYPVRTYHWSANWIRRFFDIRNYTNFW